MTLNTNNRGFIAIISAIIISALLMAVVFSLSFRGFFGRFNILDSEFKEQSTALAESCGENAILRLAQDIDYAGPESFNIAGEICDIVSVESGASTKIIKATATVRKSVSNIKITVSDPDLDILAWEEMAEF